MNLQNGFPLQLLLIFTGKYWITRVSALSNYSDFERILYTLYKDVNFMGARKNQLNIDAAVGLTIAEANLDEIFLSPNVKYIAAEYLELMSKVRQLCDQSREYVKSHLQEKDSLFGKVLAQVDLWYRPIVWKGKTLEDTQTPNSNLTGSRAVKFIYDGVPRENESDYCLTQLMVGYTKGNICQVSNECAAMLLTDDGSRGYPLTHRLLITQVANALNCEEHPATDFENLIGEYCKNIYQDLLDLEASKFPFVAPDLVMEQMLLCGMEGYSEFVSRHYMELVLNWASPHGCYASSYKAKRRARGKRSSNLMDFGCDNHTSGVAASALSLLLRKYVENNIFDVNTN